MGLFFEMHTVLGGEREGGQTSFHHAVARVDQKPGKLFQHFLVFRLRHKNILWAKSNHIRLQKIAAQQRAGQRLLPF